MGTTCLTSGLLNFASIGPYKFIWGDAPPHEDDRVKALGPPAERMQHGDLERSSAQGEEGEADGDFAASVDHGEGQLDARQLDRDEPLLRPEGDRSADQGHRERQDQRARERVGLHGDGEGAARQAGGRGGEQPEGERSVQDGLR